MGISPPAFWNMTPSELFFVGEAWIESRGGVTRRQETAARRDLKLLKQRYPDKPAAA